MIILVMHSLLVPISHLYIFLAETCLSSFGSRLSVLALLCFLPPPQLCCVVNANFFSDTHLCSPHNLSPPLGVLFIFLIVFFRGVFEIAPCMNFFENYSDPSQFFFPQNMLSPSLPYISLSKCFMH